MVLRGVTRREVLRGLLGALAGEAACARQPEIHWDGDFVDGSMTSGHALRDGALAHEAPPASPEPVPILILGAGAAGLVSAWALTRAGRRDLRILELEDEPGGTSRGGMRGGLRYPWAAHYLPAPLPGHSALLELLAEIGAYEPPRPSALLGPPGPAGTFDELQLCASPKERVWFRGFWYEGLLPRPALDRRDQEQLARFKAEVDVLVAYRDPDGRRALTLPIDDSTDAPEIRKLDQLSFAEWLDQRGFDSPRLRWYLGYGCRDDFGAEPSETSAWAGLHYHVARIQQAGEESAEFLTWPEGNQRLIDHLLGRVGRERLATGVMVTALLPADEGRRVRVEVVERATGRRRSYLAERVIFALPAFLRRYLLRAFDAPPYEPPYAPWLVANVHLSEPPGSLGYPEAWDNVFYGSRSLGYVVATHQLPRWRGSTVWTYYLPLAGADPKKARAELLGLTWREVADAAVSELAGAHFGLPERVTRVDVMRWGHGMVRPEVGVIGDARRKAAARPVGPIHFAHTDLSGVALFEEAFHHGLRAAREVLSAMGGA